MDVVVVLRSTLSDAVSIFSHVTLVLTSDCASSVSNVNSVLGHDTTGGSLSRTFTKKIHEFVLPATSDALNVIFTVVPA